MEVNREQKEGHKRRSTLALGSECGSSLRIDGYNVSGASVSEQTLCYWRDLFIEGGCECLSGGVSPERVEGECLKKEFTEHNNNDR